MFDDLINFVRNWYQTDDFIPLHEPRFGESDKKYVLDAIDSTFVSSVGEYVNRFEKELAAFLGAKRAVVTVNGTAALQVALNLAGVRENEEVITQALSFVATANTIVYNGAHPVFVDVDRETMGLSPLALQEFLEEFAEKGVGGTYNKVTGRRIAAIVPMHTFGHPCRIDALLDMADMWQIPVVEDAAEALGSYFLDKPCGTFGVCGIFSFNGNKTITSGGGGAIVTDDEALADRAKHLTTTAKVNHPWEYVHDEVGYNYRMPNLNAALACAQLEHLCDFLADKRLLAREYENLFAGLDWGDFVREPAGCLSNYWLNAVILSSKNERDAFLKFTNDAGVMTRPLWSLLSELKMFQHCQKDLLENSTFIQERAANIPSSTRIKQ